MLHLKDIMAKFLPDLGQKWQKPTIFKNFTLVSYKVTKLMTIISVFLN